MRVRDIKRWLAPLRNTPLHPQWLIRHQLNASDVQQFCGTTLDIGCADQATRQLLPETADYIGLDHHWTATQWYQSTPHIFADARHLPFKAESIDHVLLLHVLEHLASPSFALSEIHRVLRAGGTALIEVPYLYPVHDAPLDFRRWTTFGIKNEIEKTGLVVDSKVAIGRPAETGALLFNLAISHMLLAWMKNRSAWVMTAPLLALLIPTLNVLGWLIGTMQSSSEFMPHRIRVHCHKPS